MAVADGPGPQNLAWRALRYVLGEMSDAEAADFEERLHHDLAACEAVAEAVELAGAVARIDLTTIPVPTRHPRRVALVGLAAAVMLTATVAFWRWPHPGSSGEGDFAVVSSRGEVDPTATEHADEALIRGVVALAWAELRVEVDPFADPSVAVEPGLDAGAAMTGEFEISEVHPDEPDLSSWMIELAALAVEPGDTEAATLEN